MLDAADHDNVLSVIRLSPSAGIQANWDIMFEIGHLDDHTLFMRGRLDASRTQQASAVFATLEESTVLDFDGLIYISSSGLGIMLATQRRLDEKGAKLRIINASDHLKDLFRVTRFDVLFDIE